MGLDSAVIYVNFGRVGYFGCKIGYYYSCTAQVGYFCCKVGYTSCTTLAKFTNLTVKLALFLLN